MKKTAYLVLIIFILGFAATAQATAMYYTEGMFFRSYDSPNAQEYFSGTINIQGVDTIFDLKQGQTYQWSYQFSYFNLSHQLLGTSSHEGSVEAIQASFPPPSIGPLQLDMLGDNNSRLFYGIHDGFMWEEDTFFPTPNPVLGGVASRFELVTVPEPSILLMIGCSLLAIVTFRKKMRAA